MTTTIQQADLIESISAALQYISYDHPADYIAHRRNTPAVIVTEIVAGSTVDMPVTVAVDAGGTSAHITGPAEWQKRIASGEFKTITLEPV